MQNTIYLFILCLHLLGQRCWSPDELNDTHIGRIACIWNCMRMQFLAKLHAHATVHAIFEEMQLCQYGCLSTRLDFRNAFLWDEDPKKITSIIFSKLKIGLVFPLHFFKFPLYLLKKCMCTQFQIHAILPIWVSFNSSGLQECCP